VHLKDVEERKNVDSNDAEERKNVDLKNVVEEQKNMDLKDVHSKIVDCKKTWTERSLTARTLSKNVVEERTNVQACHRLIDKAPINNRYR
jgi:hypothetical protein